VAAASDVESKESGVTDLAQRLLDESYLEGDFILSSGRRSRFYLDKYLFETAPDLLRDLAEALAAKLPAYEPFDLLAGPELGAVPLVAATSLASGKRFVIVRKEQKGYGTKRLLEGRYDRGQSVVAIEDVVTSGGQAVAAIRCLGEAGLEVKGMLCVVDREQGGADVLTGEGIGLDPLFTATSLGIKVKVEAR
jgi:orotate phosphoribosyltransferase